MPGDSDAARGARNKETKLLGVPCRIMPTNGLRCFLYCKLLGYKIAVHTRAGTILAVNQAELVECSIGRKTIVGPIRMTVEKGATIGPMNNFHCGWWTTEGRFKSASYDRLLNIGMNTLITSNHHFDIVGSFVLGDHSWIAGTGSQFGTHGAGAPDRDIAIGKRCYIGTAVLFAPGSSVGDNRIVGLGSVVTRKLGANNAMIAGHPAKVIRDNYDWKTKQELRYTPGSTTPAEENTRDAGHRALRGLVQNGLGLEASGPHGR